MHRVERRLSEPDQTTPVYNAIRITTGQPGNYAQSCKSAADCLQQAASSDQNFRGPFSRTSGRCNRGNLHRQPCESGLMNRVERRLSNLIRQLRSKTPFESRSGSREIFEAGCACPLDLPRFVTPSMIKTADHSTAIAAVSHSDRQFQVGGRTSRQRIGVTSTPTGASRAQCIE